MKNKFYLNNIPVYRIILEDNRREYRIYEDDDSNLVIITSGQSSELADWQLVLSFIKDQTRMTVRDLIKVNEVIEVIIK